MPEPNPKILFKTVGPKNIVENIYSSVGIMAENKDIPLDIINIPTTLELVDEPTNTNPLPPIIL